MKENFRFCLDQVLRYEGGKVDHPKDPGGRTAFGVTQKVYDAWRVKQGKPKDDVFNIARSEIEAIYRQEYWDRVRGDDLPAGLDLAVFDYAVNSGVSRAVRHLQGVVGVAQDGVIGPATLQAVRAYVALSLCDRRLAFLKGLATWVTFGKGWSSRVADVRKRVTEMSK